MTAPINGVSGAVNPLAGIDINSPEINKSGEPNAFNNMLTDMIKNVESANKEADTAVQGLISGQSQDLHQVMLAVHKADLSLRLALEVRNKLVDAYHEVMRMSI